METRIAIIGIIVEDVDATGDVNEILHDYGMYILGRMGLPYREKNLNIISIAIDAPTDVINQIAGKLGKFLVSVRKRCIRSFRLTKNKEDRYEKTGYLWKGRHREIDDRIKSFCCFCRTGTKGDADRM